jgi:hypothetical protein
MPKNLGVAQYLILVALMIPTIGATFRLSGLGCPRDSFIHGSASSHLGGWEGLVQLVIIVVALFFPARLLLYYASRNPLLRAQFDEYYPRFDLRLTAMQAGAAMLLVVLSVLLLNTDQLCASATMITERHHFWDAPVSHRWGDIVMVETYCAPGSRGSWNQAYVLTFRDGKTVDLSANAGPLADRKAGVFAALHGRSFTFDDRQVDPNCIEPFRDMATTHP